MTENRCNIKFPNPAVPASVVAIGLILAGVSIGDSIKYFKDFDRYVEVKGLAESTVKSDQASWQITVASSGNDLKAIYKTINNEQEIITNFLSNDGFTIADIQKQPIVIIDNQANAYSSNTHTSKYSATAGVTVTSKNVDKINNAVQQTNELIDSGVLITNNYVSYSYNGLNKIKTNMLNEAIANAKHTAVQFANQSNSQLGRIRTASQGLFIITAPDGSVNDSSINKKVRVVTSVQFFLR